MNKLSKVDSYAIPKISDHQFEEESQWLRLVGDPNPAKAMLLVFIQKLCAAFHELGPAFEMKAIRDESLDYIKARLASRAKAVVERLASNGYGEIDGAGDLSAMIERLEVCADPAEIIEMSEEVHLINHRLCDALEAI